MIQRIILLLAGLVAGASMHGQAPSDSVSRNVIKVNAPALRFRNISLQYERILRDHWTAEAGISYKWGGGLPKFLGWGDFVFTSNTAGLRGFSISPEVKYYFMRSEETIPGSGVYAGAYSKFTRMYGNLGFRYWNGSEYIDATGYGDLHEVGLGIQLGYQLTIRNRLTFDFMFMGPRRSYHWLALELESDYVEELVPLIEDAINRRLEAVGADPITVPASASSNLGFWFTNFRYTVCVGYRF